MDVGIRFASFILGVFYTVGILQYDGSAPINLLTAFFFLVLLTGLFSLMSLYFLLSIYLPVVPGKEFLSLLYRRLNFATAFLSRLSGRFMPESLDGMEIDQLLPARTRKLWLLKLVSGAGLWFSVGIVSGVLFLASTQDLAFYWSTSLGLDSERMREWIAAISLPWKTLGPSAVPSANLVEVSRFFRIEDSKSLAGFSEQLPRMVEVSGDGSWDLHIAAQAARIHCKLRSVAKRAGAESAESRRRRCHCSENADTICFFGSGSY